VRGAALDGGQSHVEGLAAWPAVRFWPHVLTDVEDVSTRVTVLGTDVATPVLTAPMNRQRDIHPQGEVETARGAAAGSLLALSTYAEVDLGECTRQV
jgi:4-hydroxymandelate oxidase